jgi:hypothetical protein
MVCTILEKTSVHTPSGLPHNPRQFLLRETPVMTVIACGRNRRLGGGLTWPFSGEAWLLPHGGPGSGLCSVERGRARPARRMPPPCSGIFSESLWRNTAGRSKRSGLKSSKNAGGALGRRHIITYEVPDQRPASHLSLTGEFFDNSQTGNGAWQRRSAAIPPPRGESGQPPEAAGRVSGSARRIRRADTETGQMQEPDNAEILR